MATFCAISNEVPEQPCVSPVSGAVFERRLIERYLEDHDTDPVNGEPLSVEQLIDIKTTALAKPRPPSATSIPAILKILQDEWDAVMLHSFTLRQQLQTARQELSHALYQHDAACRVIARLTKEVTAAREALATLKPQVPVVIPGGALPSTHLTAMEGDEEEEREDEEEVGADERMVEEGMSEKVLEKLQSRASQLTSERRQRGKAEGLVPPQQVAAYQQTQSYVGLHSPSVPGLLALDICLSNSSQVVTGGNDKNAVIFNKDTEQVIAVLKGHTKKVTSVLYHPTEDLVFTASPDTTVRVWGVKQAQTALVIRAHQSPVTGLSLHATGDYLLSSSIDSKWAFSDLRTGRVLTSVTNTDVGDQQGLTCAQLHPDGLIFGTGTSDSLIKIWDLKERKNVANFDCHSGPITSIAFSENGYYLASASDDSVVKLWDLRKLKNFKSITLDENYKAKSLKFDYSGTYLAIAGTDVRVYLVKQWQELAVLTNHTAHATAVGFGANASFLASTSMDRTLKFFTAAE